MKGYGSLGFSGGHKQSNHKTNQRVLQIYSTRWFALDKSVMLERIQYCGFFVVGANADFPFWLCYFVRTFVELDTKLVPHLGNVEGVNIESVLIFDIGLDDGIGGN